MIKNKNIGAKIGEYGAFIALAFLFILLSIISPEFRTGSNLLNLLRQASFNGLIAFGMTLVILSDGIDLSVGSVFALAAIIAAELIMVGLNAVLAVLIALVAGVVLGLVSGFLVAKCRLQAFIATLITMTAYRGLAYIITDGKPISRLAESATSGAFFFKALGKGNVLLFEAVKIPIPAIILVVTFLIVLFVAFVMRGYTIASRAPDTFSSLVAYGISTHVGLQALLNICVVADIIPNTGISLPFFSYGGSSLIVLLGEMGILLSISRQYYMKRKDLEEVKRQEALDFE